jgi:hypothetical protein
VGGQWHVDLLIVGRANTNGQSGAAEHHLSMGRSHWGRLFIRPGIVAHEYHSPLPQRARFRPRLWAISRCMPGTFVLFNKPFQLGE